MKVRKAVITAAGWGTRFLPSTKSQPKEMLPLVNKPLIQYSVEEAIACAGHPWTDQKGPVPQIAFAKEESLDVTCPIAEQ